MKNKIKYNMNKSAEERYLSPFMFLVWGIIAFGIIMSMIIFYSTKVDVRKQEANILSSVVIDCITENGNLKPEVLKQGFDIYSYCNIDRTMFAEGFLYLGIYFYNGDNFDKKFTDPKNPFANPMIYGNKDFELQCKLKEDAEAKSFAECMQRNIFVLYNGETIKLNIITGSNQVSDQQ
jgi:hypothetical protein